MLPKIAERELRQFANLRSTSSEFGVKLPLDKVLLNSAANFALFLSADLAKIYGKIR